MKEPEEIEEEWLSYTFVSDESRIADFLFEITNCCNFSNVSAFLI